MWGTVRTEWVFRNEEEAVPWGAESAASTSEDAEFRNGFLQMNLYYEEPIRCTGRLQAELKLRSPFDLDLTGVI